MTDIEIASKVKGKNILDIAKNLNIPSDALEFYGNYKAKIDFTKIKNNKKGKLVLVTAISPTPYGEGKTTVSIGLDDALCKMGKKSILALREPSLGPVFGMKGGATGGGYSQIIPMEDINLHFTGDFHAITTANNLLCAAIDNHLYFGNALNINPNTITFSRCMDMNDRALRTIKLGLSSSKEVEREDHFNITAASELMAILCLARDEDNLRERIDSIVIGYTYDKKEVFAKDLKVTGSMMTILKDAIKPNLVQTLEGNPAIVHGGPFANIAHGCNTIIATNTALSLGDYVITEAGFGADLGAEKFLDIKCRVANLKPDAIVLVATLKALKYNAGVLKDDILRENVNAVKIGSCNLKAHIENLKSYGIPVVVAINKYNDDTDKELNVVRDLCKDLGVSVEVSTAYLDGGDGAVSLAEKVLDVINEESTLTHPYELEDELDVKIEKLAKKIYHASSIKYSEEAKEKINNLKNSKYALYPICVAKTQYSLSDDASKLGNPRDYEITVKDVRLYAGAKFITILLNDIMTMPGLPKVPNYENLWNETYVLCYLCFKKGGIW